MLKEFFGTSRSGKRTHLYTLINKQGTQLVVSDFGAIIRNLIVRDKSDMSVDVVLGYESLEKYTTNYDTYFGATVGRVANRIKDGKFNLDGKKYTLDQNNDGNCLHSGFNGYHTRLWKVTDYRDSVISLSLTSPDKDQGFDGNLQLTVTFELTDHNELVVTYEGNSDKKTLFNPTNHTYFNLNGHKSGSILNHDLTIEADYFVPVGPNMIPTGDFQLVTDTPMDFRTETKIGKRLNDPFDQFVLTKGYDHHFVTNEGPDSHLGLKTIAHAKGDLSGIKMTVISDRPGVQLYTANFVSDELGKDGAEYQARDGFCLETQYAPDAINQTNFAKPIIFPNKKVVTQTIFKFNTTNESE
ncbi:aldose epimerase family protein [Bavariicoccus seileri]|uniref:aldose epimerase family protein n=1 Tax=Bavariicoccus seileri TaxID=549685 RepID=UPI003F923702